MDKQDTGLIEAASGGCRTMADGTLRIEFDIEPRFAVAAFTLFGQRGTAAVLGRLVAPAPAAQRPESPTAAPQKAASAPRARLSPLCEWAVMRCEEPDFQQWCTDRWEAGDIAAKPAEHAKPADFAKAVLLELCGVASRKDIDGNADATQRFHDLVRAPYSEWLRVTA